jgi:hypothetical protein
VSRDEEAALQRALLAPGAAALFKLLAHALHGALELRLRSREAGLQLVQEGASAHVFLVDSANDALQPLHALVHAVQSVLDIAFRVQQKLRPLPAGQQ